MTASPTVYPIYPVAELPPGVKVELQGRNRNGSGRYVFTRDGPRRSFDLAAPIFEDLSGLTGRMVIARMTTRLEISTREADEIMRQTALHFQRSRHLV